MKTRAGIIITAIVLLILPRSVQGEVTLPAILGDNMVLQLGREIPFWGWAESGEEITVSLSCQDPLNPADTEAISTSVITAADGRWTAKLPAQSKPCTVEIKITGKNRLTLSNVLLGDVWLCSGQSNMEWPVSASMDHEDEIAAAEFPSIRIFKVERSTSRVPQFDLEGNWVVCSPETVGELSAVGYFFGRKLHQELKRPIGLVQAAHGGAICEAWTSLSALKADPDFSPILDRANRAANDPIQTNSPNRASVLYNGMIAPLQGFSPNHGLSLKGIIWYQGESNANRAYQYRKLFPALITDWRRGWGQPELPFLYVQLANYLPDKTKPDHPDEPEESAWAELREAQSRALSVPKTGMAVTIDLGEPRDIHPKNKQEIGRRLALSAFKVAYGQDVAASGPQFKSMSVEDQQVHLDFHEASEGLVATGDELKGFAVAGADRKFVWAEAKIVGGQVRVSSARVTKPVAVRYAWGDNPESNLSNQSGLPAIPFRTDDWPTATIENR